MSRAQCHRGTRSQTRSTSRVLLLTKRKNYKKIKTLKDVLIHLQNCVNLTKKSLYHHQEISRENRSPAHLSALFSWVRSRWTTPINLLVPNNHFSRRSRWILRGNNSLLKPKNSDHSMQADKPKVVCRIKSLARPKTQKLERLSTRRPRNKSLRSWSHHSRRKRRMDQTSGRDLTTVLSRLALVKVNRATRS